MYPTTWCSGEASQVLLLAVTFLGQQIDADGIHPTDKKLKAIVQAPPPENVQ